MKTMMSCSTLITSEEKKKKRDRQTHWYECSNCGARRPCNHFGKEYSSNYCPNCGTKMKDTNKK